MNMESNRESDYKPAAKLQKSFRIWKEPLQGPSEQ